MRTPATALRGPAQRGPLSDSAVVGVIREKWIALGGMRFPGPPLDVERVTEDGVGRRQRFARADILWHPRTGAFSLYGEIREKWSTLGGPGWGYPTTDESGTPDRIGRYNHFAFRGVVDRSIYWTRRTGAVSVAGDIRRLWAEQGWEQGRLGYPLSEEGDMRNGRRGQRFDGGTISWDGREWSAGSP
jgi:uncharacterized protein with LGFP repeats